jgi:hypothetical protein
MAEIEQHKGTVLRINNAGLGVVEDEHSQQQFVFTFDKIQNYRGEEARELGLTVGSHVRFNATADCQVTTVEIIRP